MTVNNIVMDQSAINRSLSRIAHEILERNKGTWHSSVFAAAVFRWPGDWQKKLNKLKGFLFL